MNTDVVLVIGNENINGKAIRTLRRELRLLAKPGRSLTLDLSRLQKANLDCADLICEAQRRSRRVGGILKLVGLGSSVQAFFELMGISRLLDVDTNPASGMAKQSIA